MTDSLKSLIATGTKLWLDSIDPDLVAENRARGASGATSNPIIVSDLLKTGRFDEQLDNFRRQGLNDEAVAWAMTDQLVRQAQDVFHPVWLESQGNDGYVSFELDPLLEDLELGPPHDQRTARYVELGKQWAAGHDNRMIKVPATPAGLDALEDLAAAGVTLNVTLIFSTRQYHAAREAVWRGAQRRSDLTGFKSVYSIFVSRLDVYTEKHIPDLSAAAQGHVGIVNAKRLWTDNVAFWKDKKLPLAQEIIFASTGTKRPEDPPWKYVAAFAGGDIQTNPPATNQAVLDSGREFTPELANFPPDEILAEIDAKVDFDQLERVLMEEGLKKFADPQKALLELIASKRRAMA
ncbi:MAG: transaldolase [Planctomycetaceae bacterium]|nr:transaldolase [Planctomycetales bacterium]MCB9923103.1 transaldolase [Planctomycetaceae bacterium]